MQIILEEVPKYLNLDEKTIKVLDMISKNTGYVKMSEFFQVLSIMEFNDYDTLDRIIDKIVLVDNVIKANIPESTTTSKDTVSIIFRGRAKSNDENKNKSKKTKSKTSEKKTEKKPKESAKKVRKERTKLTADEIYSMINNYIETHGRYTIAKLAKDLNISETTARRYCLKIDPNREKISSTNVMHYIDYINLSDAETSRQNWLTDNIKMYSDKLGISKSAVMNPIYKKLVSSYGIVFEQLSKDMMYNNGLTIEDYPMPTKQDVLVSNENVFNIAKSIMTDMYGQ